MIVTLTWKELREHRAIWFAMVGLTAFLGVGAARIVAPTDIVAANAVAAVSIIGLAVVYGVVCGAMMFAGEHEGGTLPFLDVFLRRRGLLWAAKATIGAILAIAQALAVAFILKMMQQMPPSWCHGIVGISTRAAQTRGALAPDFWFLLLPVITLESYAWGLFGSALARKVLPAAALGALVATPLWMFALCAPSASVLGLRIALALAALVVSGAAFVWQSRDALMGSLLTMANPPDAREKFIELWEELERDVPPLAAKEVLTAPRPRASADNDEAAVDVAAPTGGGRVEAAQASAPTEVLWWLTWQQAWGLCVPLALASLVSGAFMPMYGQVLWPLATFAIGLACGTASFAAEQRDLSYQFLAAQHLPLSRIWRFRTLFWSAAALVLTSLVAAGALLMTAWAGGEALPVALPGGTLLRLLGPALFYGIWLVYGYAAGQVLVWLCRKAILALMLGIFAAAGLLGLWLPSLLCGGMSGWPLWLPPLLLLSASALLMRAWAGGRIKERRPVATLVAASLLAVLWTSLNLGQRAFELPDVGAPQDWEGFREALKTGPENVAGQKLQVALSLIEEAGADEERWRALVAEAARLPPGMIEVPRADGQDPYLRHLPFAAKMTERLRALADGAARAGRPLDALAHLSEILALSRNLRNRAPVSSYLFGVTVEASALDGLAQLVPGSDAPLLRRALGALDQHAAQTPPPRSSLEAECFRAGGLVKDPTLWIKAPARLRERWLAGSISMSLDTPWEDERKQRLWQLVWAGLFRNLATPRWQLPAPVEPALASDTTRKILQGWLPADHGLAIDELARFLDSSWLCEERLFAPVVALREGAAAGHWRTDSTRLVVALALYRLEHRLPAARLADLVPAYLQQLPIDPYSGASVQYRVSAGERVDTLDGHGWTIRNGQALIWSTGPDASDDGGHKHAPPGAAIPRGEQGFDLISQVPEPRSR